MTSLLEKALLGLLWLSVAALVGLAVALPSWLPLGTPVPSFLPGLPF